MAKDLTNDFEVSKSLLKVLTDLNDDNLVPDVDRVIAKVRVSNILLRLAVEQSKYDTKMGYTKKVDFFEQ